jgi:hypothetical protein
VHDGGDALAPAVAHAVGEQHERAGQRAAVEQLGGALGAHHRRHGAERLAPLDLVQPLRVAGVARVGEQAAVAQRPRPVLATALEPGHDAVRGQRLGHRLRDVVGALVGDRGGVEPGPDLVVVPGAPERGAAHRGGRVAQLGGHLERGPERGPGVAGRRLHPQIAERRLAPYARVGDAVQRDTAGKRQARLAGPLVKPGGELDEHLLEAPLHRRREVGVGRHPPVAVDERGGEALPLHRIRPEAARTVGADEPPERVQVLRRAVRRHRHDLVLVRGTPEAEVRGELLVAQTERVRQALRRQARERAVRAQVPGPVRGALAAAVDHEHGAALPARRPRGRGGVRDVMGHEAQAPRVEARERRRHEARGALREQRAQALPRVGGDVAVGLGREARIVGVRHRVELLRGEAHLVEAEADRLLGELPGREGHGALAVLAP